MTQMQKTRTKQGQHQDHNQDELNQDHKESKIKSNIDEDAFDALMNDIDDALDLGEVSTEDFVNAFVQKGGE